MSAFASTAEEAARRYMETVTSAVGLLAGTGLLLSLLAGSFFYAAGGPTWDWNGLSVAFAVGSLVALLMVVVVLIGLVAALFAIRDVKQRALDLDRARQTENEAEFEDEEEPDAPQGYEEEEPEPVPTPAFETPPVEPLAIAATNKANELYKRSLAVLADVLFELSKEKDGEKLARKPFSYDTLHAAGKVSSWEDWGELVGLWEQAGIGHDLRRKAGWSFDVGNVRDVEQRLSGYFITQGYVFLNGILFKK